LDGVLYGLSPLIVSDGGTSALELVEGTRVIAEFAIPQAGECQIDIVREQRSRGSE
jgi:hypothetical protein